MSKTTKVQRENYDWFYEQPIDIKFEMVQNPAVPDLLLNIK